MPPIEAIRVGFRSAKGAGLAGYLRHAPLPGRSLGQMARERDNVQDRASSVWDRPEQTAIHYDASGNPTGVVLRDPYGQFRTITDFTRIYFCIGGAVSMSF